MAKKQELLDQWITSKAAAEILTERSGHTVSDNYVRRLGATGAIERKEIDKRTILYLKSDVESYQVRKRGDGSIRRAARAPRTKPIAADVANEQEQKGDTSTTK